MIDRTYCLKSKLQKNLYNKIPFVGPGDIVQIYSHTYFLEKQWKGNQKLIKMVTVWEREHQETGMKETSEVSCFIP